MKLYLALSPHERTALSEMARQELRSPREQLRYLLREAARQRGLLHEREEVSDAAHA